MAILLFQKLDKVFMIKEWVVILKCTNLNEKTYNNRRSIQKIGETNSPT
jgi:hypothetical protein